MCRFWLAPISLITNETFVINTIDGLGAGNYTVQVSDANDCPDEEPFLIFPFDIIPPEPITIEECSLTQIATYCLENGQYSIEVSGGCNLPYTFALYEADSEGNPLGDCNPLQTSIQNESNMKHGVHIEVYY